MGEQIPFPNDYERHLWLGDKAFSEENYLKAASEYHLAYELNENLELAQKLIEVLMELQDFKGAIALAEFYSQDFLSNQTDFSTYFRLLVLDRQYLLARKTLLVVAKEMNFEADFVADCLGELAQIEAVQPLIEPHLSEQKRKLLKSFNESQQPLGQNQWQTFSEGLTYPLFLELVTDCLAQITNPFLRPRLVEELLRLGFDERLMVTDLDGGVQEVDFQNLSLPEADPAFKTMTTYLEEQLGQLDPVMSAGLIQEMQSHFALAFPFNPEKEQPEAWAQSYLMDYKRMFGEADNEPQSAMQLTIQRQKEQLAMIILGLNQIN